MTELVSNHSREARKCSGVFHHLQSIRTLKIRYAGPASAESLRPVYLFLHLSFPLQSHQIFRFHRLYLVTLVKLHDFCQNLGFELLAAIAKDFDHTPSMLTYHYKSINMDFYSF